MTDSKPAAMSGTDRGEALPVHVIEPTLQGVSGHCLNLVKSLCEAGRGLDFRLWVGRHAKLPELAGLVSELRPYFWRQIRKPQAFLLYRKLLRGSGRIVVTTATTLDLYALDWGARGVVPPGKVFLYFHQARRLKPKKLERFKRLAAKQPNLTMMGTTPAIEQVFRDSGFRHTVTLRLPPGIDPRAFAAEPMPFRRLLFAGAARADKGVGAVVDLVEHLARIGEQVPITVQTSADHYGKYDSATIADLERLRSVSYSPLTTLPDALPPKAYAEAFAGGISLQPYKREEYANKMSGVILDALSAGCPVVTISGTSMAEIVKRFDAGVVVDSSGPEALLDACRTIIADYARYHERARCAGAVLREENSWAPLVERLRVGEARAA
jgi:glycosyltransferase involved in cell wall biosynthesis